MTCLEYALAQLFEAREVAGLIPDGGYWDFSEPTMDLGVDSVTNRNELQGYLLGGKSDRIPYVWLLCGYSNATARRIGLYQIRCTAYKKVAPGDGLI